MIQTPPQTDSRSRKARLHRVTVHGNEGPVVVMAHGFGTDQSAWQHVMPALLPDFRIVTFDHAGAGPHGSETFDADRYADVESYADDLLQLLDELGQRDCFYVGASMSGIIGVLAAIEQPTLFRKLILLGASPRYLNAPGYVGGFDQPTLDGLFAAMSNNYHEWVSGFAPIIIHDVPESSAVREFASGLFALRPDIAISTARTIFQSDLRDRLPLLATPTTILQMRNDIAVPVAVGEYLRASIAQSTLDIIAAEGHLPHLSAPDVVSAALQRHLV